MIVTLNNVKLYSRRGGVAGFTIVELLVVIVVLGILGVLSLYSLDPAEISRRSRDSTRISDIQSLNRVLSVYQTDSNTVFGSANTVYISLPDSSASCSTYTLPTLPSGWSYACKPASTYRNIDGTGWIPIDISTSSTAARLSALPIDPVNSATNRCYYSYITANNSWELNAVMEAKSDTVAGFNDKVSSDGGDDPTRLEIGTNLALAPWSFEFSAFPIVALNSGFPGWRNYAPVGTVTIGSDSTAANYARFTGYLWYIWQENIPFNSESIYKMTCRFRQVVDPTTGGKGFFCGWAGVGSDGVTLVNTTGLNTHSSQHYHAVTATSLIIGDGWATYSGYTKGWGSPNGSGTSCISSASPCKMHADVRYVRPLFITNYSSGDGTMDIDYISITKM